MKRKASMILFGLSFLVAILGEAYLLNMPTPHLFSIIGIGIVVILTGYLFLESICEYITSINKEKELLWEETLRLDSEKWDSRYTELLNIQKATYTALKKSDARTQEQLKLLSDELNQIIQLQKKAIDGQMKALNISVNYSKKHTREIIDNLKEEDVYNNTESESNIEANQTADKDMVAEKAAREIKPLYDDPNAALSADEIAQLFESHGR